MIEILEKYTPYLQGGKKLYEEKDVLRMLETATTNVVKKVFQIEEEKENRIEQYPEAHC